MRIPYALCLAALVAAPAAAQEASSPATDPVTEKVRLVHQQPHDVIRLLTDPRPNTGLETTPSLVPSGIRGILGYPLDSSLLIHGAKEAIAVLKHGLSIVDVPVTKTKKGQSRLDLMLKRVKPEELQERLLRMPISGSRTVTVQGQRVILDGNAEWIRAALRLAMQMEMDAPPAAPVERVQ